jgi:hypothetical protein
LTPLKDTNTHYGIVVPQGIETVENQPENSPFILRREELKRQDYPDRLIPEKLKLTTLRLHKITLVKDALGSLLTTSGCQHWLFLERRPEIVVAPYF